MDDFAPRYRNLSFFLIDGELVMGDWYHDQYLSKLFGVQGWGKYFRYVFPRGRVSNTGDGQIYVEASPELRPYKDQIAYKAHIMSTDNAKWDFDCPHYVVGVPVKPLIQDIESEIAYEGPLNSNVVRFLKKYVPEVYAWYQQYADQDRMSNWLTEAMDHTGVEPAG